MTYETAAKIGMAATLLADAVEQYDGAQEALARFSEKDEPDPAFIRAWRENVELAYTNVMHCTEVYDKLTAKVHTQMGDLYSAHMHAFGNTPLPDLS